MCNAKKPIKVIKSPMGLHEFVRTECKATHLEVVNPGQGSIVPGLAWWWRIYEWCVDGSLVFIRETKPSRYEVHKVESMIGVRLAA